MKERLRWRAKARNREVGVEKGRAERIEEDRGGQRPFSRLPVTRHSGSTGWGKEGARFWRRRQWLEWVSQVYSY